MDAVIQLCQAAGLEADSPICCVGSIKELATGGEDGAYGLMENKTVATFLADFVRTIRPDEVVMVSGRMRDITAGECVLNLSIYPGKDHNSEDE